MAQPNKVIKQHNIQRSLAEQEFAKYIDYITEEINTKYGKSYQRVEDIKDNWRKTFDYSQEREEFIITKTKHFLRLFPTTSRDYKSPVFFKNIIGLISDYLSVYSMKKGIKNRNICTAEIRDKLYYDNPHVNLETNRYISQNERAWGLQQKRNRKRIQAKQQHTESENNVSNLQMDTVEYSRYVDLKLEKIRAELGLTK